MLPFTREQFFDVFAGYNEAIWPAQLVAYALGIAAAAHVFQAARRNERVTIGTLAGLWLWTGIVYHWVYFSEINSAAYLFGLLFVAQAGALFYFAEMRGTLRLGQAPGWTPFIGVGLIVYALLLYPMIGSLSGHVYPRAPSFGLTPCPLAIYTFGLLLLSVSTVPKLLLVVPLLWSLIGGTAAFLLDLPQDWALIVVGPAATAWLWRRDRVGRAHVSPA